MEVLEAIRTRRSIRKFKSTPVDDKILEIVLEAARLAPSWANTQCWRFIVVGDANTRAALADTLSTNNRGIDALKQAPVAIVACAELGKAGILRGQVYKGEWHMFDVALAMEHLALEAHSLGLGTVHLGAFDAAKAAEILHVPEGYCVVEMTPLGYPEFQPEARPRKELSEVVYYEKFGQSKG